MNQVAVSGRVEAIYELTPAQAGMLFDIELGEDAGAYVIQQTIETTGPLDGDLAAAALRALTRRHDALRTLILHRGVSEPRQVVLRERAPDFRTVDFGGADDAAAKVRAHAAADHARGFNLETDPLVRLTHCLCGPNRAALIWTMHHILLDGWCGPMLYRDFVRFYEALRAGEDEGALNERIDAERAAEPRYRDFVVWLRRIDQAEGLAYWDGVLAGAEHLPQLTGWGPPDPRGRDAAWAPAAFSGGDGRGGTASTGAIGLSRVRAAGARVGATSSTLVNAAWGLTLWRLTGMTDVVFGQVVAGRDVPIAGMDSVLGLFINTIPVRLVVEPETSVGGLMAAFARQAAESLGHTRCSLADIQARQSSPGPLVTTAVVYESALIAEQDHETIGGVGVARIVPPHQIGYPQGLIAEEFGDELRLAAYYDPRVYPDAQGAAMGALVGRTLEALVVALEAGGTASVASLDLVGPAERRRVLDEFNPAPPVADPPATLTELIEEALADHPDQVVLTCQGRDMTARELHRLAARVAHSLAEVGVGRGDYVAVVAERRSEAVAAMVGVLMAGAAYVPIDPEFPVARIESILADAVPKAALVVGARPPGLDGVPAVIDLDSPTWRRDPAGGGAEAGIGRGPDAGAPVLQAARPEDPAYCLFTSGSTGRPKGVVVEHRQLVHLMRTQLVTRLLHGATLAGVMAFTFDPHANDLWGGLIHARRVVLATERELAVPAEFDAMMHRGAVTKIFTTPARLTHLTSDPAHSGWLEQCAVMGIGGEPLTADLVRRVQAQTSGRIVNLYGPTETTVWATAGEIDGPEWIDIGYPLDGYPMYVLDGLTLLGVGMPGELVIGGDGVARGYLDRPELNAERFIPNPFGPGRCYRTGDLVRWLPSGRIEFLGRLDDQVKIRGVRIELGEIATALRELPGVADAVALVHRGPDGEPALVAYYVAADAGLDLSPEAARAALARRLPWSMIPQGLGRVDAIPMNASGKVDRAALPALTVDRTPVAAPPRDAAERVVAEVFAQVLEVEAEWVGVYEDFFALGGHSLRATRAVNAIEARTGVRLRLRDFFAAATVEGIASLLREESARAAAAAGSVEGDSAVQNLDGADGTGATVGASATAAVAGGENASGAGPAGERAATEVAPWGGFPGSGAGRDAARAAGFRSIAQVGGAGRYPVSAAQRRLIALDRIDDVGTAYNIPFALALRGPIDEARLAQAFVELVQRHEALRTGFHVDDAGPVQIVADRVEAELEIVTVPDIATPEAVAALVEEFVRPFDLTQPPLIRMRLIYGARGPASAAASGDEAGPDGLLLVDVHHIVADGTSVNVLVEDFCALVDGQALGPAGPGYKDYVAWAEARDLSEQEAYWLEQFAEEPEALDLPTDRPRGAAQSFAGAVVTGELGVGAPARAFARQVRATEFAVVMAGVMALLGRYGRTEDTVVGVPISGRGHAQAERIVGMFVGTLALRARPRRTMTFRELVGEVHRAAVDADERQDYPFETLVERVVARRDLTRNPLFDVMVAFQNLTPPRARLRGLDVQEVPVPHHTSRFDLALNIAPRTGGGYEVLAEYATALFRAESIELLVHHLDVLLRDALTRPDVPLGELTMVDGAERARLIDAWAGTSAPLTEVPGARGPDDTILDLFAAHAEATPAKPAVECDGESVTYAQLERMAGRLAVALVEAGIGRGDRVAISLPRGIDQIAAMIGVAMAGAAWVPLDPTYPQARTELILADSAAAALIATAEIDANLAESIAGGTIRIVLTDSPVPASDRAGVETGSGATPQANDGTESDPRRARTEGEGEAPGAASGVHRVDLRGAGEPAVAPCGIGPDDLAYCIYTSGTTGRPKGAMVTHRGLASQALVHRLTVGVRAEDRVFGYANPVFDASIWEWEMALGQGATLILVPDERVLDVPWLNRQLTQRCTVAVLTPAVAAALDVSRLRVLVEAAAEAVAIEGFLGEFINAYGPTEASICASAWRRPSGHTGFPRPIPIGRPVPNYRLYVVDEDLALTGIGVPGELLIGGAGVGPGYLGLPQVTAAAFRPDPFAAGQAYRSGDLVRWTPEGDLVFMGRIDTQVKIRGQRVELGEIAATIRAVPGVADAVAVAVPRADQGGALALVAYVVGGNLAAVWDALRAQLPAALIPAAIVPLDELPTNRSGKVDVRALPSVAWGAGGLGGDPGSAGPGGGQADTAPAGGAGSATAAAQASIGTAEPPGAAAMTDPADGAAAALTAALTEVLRVPSAGAGESFFDLGGDSIGAIRLVSALRKRGWELSVRDLLSLGEVGACARAMTPLAELVDQTPLEGPVALGPIQRRFFASGYAEPGHFGQSVFLRGSRFDPAALRRALEAVVAHHDMLRARYPVPGEAGEIRPAGIGGGELVRFDRVALAGEPDLAAVEARNTAVQAGFDPAGGPLLAAVLYQASDADHLLVCAHHLVIDAVSWRVVLGDLAAAYEQAVAGREVALEPKTASYRDWVAALEGYTASPRAEAQVPYWTGVADDAARWDLPAQVSLPSHASPSITARATLDPERTAALVGIANSAYTTEPLELVLTAVGLAAREVTGQAAVAIEHETHGRHDIGRPIAIDRTVGWFTSLYPMVVDVRGELGDAIVRVKEALRAVPDGGIGYALLASRGLVATAVPALAVNYLGDTGAGFAETDAGGGGEMPAAPRRSPWPEGLSVSERNRLDNAVAINAGIADGKVFCQVTCDTWRVSAAWAERWAQEVTAALGRVVDHCTAQDHRVRTASDFAGSDLSAPELSEILGLYS